MSCDLYQKFGFFIKGIPVSANLEQLSIHDRIRLVEDIWDTIACDQQALQITTAQRDELDRRLARFEMSQERGRLVCDVIADLRRAL